MVFGGRPGLQVLKYKDEEEEEEEEKENFEFSNYGIVK